MCSRNNLLICSFVFAVQSRSRRSANVQIQSNTDAPVVSVRGVVHTQEGETSHFKYISLCKLMFFGVLLSLPRGKL